MIESIKKIGETKKILNGLEVSNFDVTVLQGSLPEFTDRYTDEDWEKHRKIVEKLKEIGEYMKPVTIHVGFIGSPFFNEDRKFIDKTPCDVMAIDLSEMDLSNYKDGLFYNNF